MLKVVLNVVLNLLFISFDYTLILQIVKINFRFQRNTKKHGHPVRHENNLIAMRLIDEAIFLQKKGNNFLFSKNRKKHADVLPSWHNSIFIKHFRNILNISHFADKMN